MPSKAAKISPPESMLVRPSVQRSSIASPGGGDREEVALRIAGRADGAGDDVAVCACPRLVLAYLAYINEKLNVGMVVGDLRERIAADEVHTAVSHVDRVDRAVDDKHADQRGPHAGKLLILLGAPQNRFVRHVDRVGEIPLCLLRGELLLPVHIWGKRALCFLRENR